MGPAAEDVVVFVVVLVVVVLLGIGVVDLVVDYLWHQYFQDSFGDGE